MKWWLKLGLAFILVVAIAILGISGFLGYSMTKVERVPIEETPVLLIHGELDEVVPLEHAYRLQRASQNPQSQLWVVPEAGHVGFYTVYPEEYMNKITAFFDTVLR